MTATLPQRLLIGVSGSVATLNLPSYLHALRVAGVAQLVAVLTYTAETFVPPATLKLICDAVYTESDHGRGHVALGRWAEQVVVLPATAHLLGCLAHGLAPNLLTTTLLATEAPITLVPAMNEVMWRRPTVQRNVDTLRSDGHRIVEPLPGSTFEVASRSIVAGLTTPPPDALVRLLSGVNAP
ncbi:flavoprotein [Actinoplanes sp. NPDC051859]|uniref:flavoprotein n=1 Tax=Actinoplanes sp. NPDC051859 TaxID=3363909 RepID=UPI0037A51684